MQCKFLAYLTELVYLVLCIYTRIPMGASLHFIQGNIVACKKLILFYLQGELLTM